MLANHRRGSRRRTALGDRLAAALRTATTVDEPAHEPLAHALARLSARDRELIALHAWEGLGPAEIAVVLGIPAATARVRLHRARRRLAADLSAESPPPGSSSAVPAR